MTAATYRRSGEGTADEYPGSLPSGCGLASSSRQKTKSWASVPRCQVSTTSAVTNPTIGPFSRYAFGGFFGSVVSQTLDPPEYRVPSAEKAACRESSASW